jgi:hypothetical protein
MDSGKIAIASTRFNSHTWNENVSYRNKIQHNGCIYGCPQSISCKIQDDSLLYIFEMNNSLNRIEGIGIIKNKIYFDNYYKIYSDGNYNRFVYKSNYRVDRNHLELYYPDILRLFELILFTGKTHLKRGFGITQVPEKLIDKYYTQIYRDEDADLDTNANEDTNNKQIENKQIDKKIDIIKRRLNTIFQKYNNRQ